MTKQTPLLDTGRAFSRDIDVVPSGEIQLPTIVNWHFSTSLIGRRLVFGDGERVNRVSIYKDGARLAGWELHREDEY
jgi:hypothetical protein